MNAISLQKPCRSPACERLITSGLYCAAHARPSARTNARATYDLTRRRDDPALAAAATIRNGARWQKFRAWFRSRNPLCCDPFGDHGAEAVAMHQVHHVEPLALHPELACDEANCRPLCTSCHARVERMERGGIDSKRLFSM